jgi:RHS repeat-associated protein
VVPPGLAGSARRSRVRLKQTAAAIAVLAAAATPAIATGASKPASGSFPSPSDPALQAAVDKVQMEQRAYEDWLQSPEAVKARQDSQTAYGALANDQALALIQDQFGRAIDNATQPLIDPNQVASYDGNYAAVLEEPSSADQQSSTVSGSTASEPAGESGLAPADPAVEPSPTDVDSNPGDGNGGLIESNVPLRVPDDQGKESPVELGLQATDTGAFQPANPIVDTTLPARLGDGVDVGNPGASIGISLPGTDPDTKALRLGDDSLFYPNIAAGDSTDLLVSAKPTGIEIFTQVRSLDAPEAERYQLDLPAGAQLQQADDGSIAITDETGEQIGRVMPPMARDVQGQQVPVSMRIDGSGFLVQTDFKGGDFAAPILVDPVIETYQTGGFAVPPSGLWPVSQTSGSPFTVCPGPSSSCSGWNVPYIHAPTGSYAANASGAKTWTIPNGTSSPDSTTAWIQSASFQNAIYSGNPTQTATPLFMAAVINTRSGSANASQVNLGNQSFSNSTINLIPSGTYPGPIDDGQQLWFGLWDYSGSTTNHSAAADAYDYGPVTINVTDPEAPTISGISSTFPSSWVDKGRYSVTVPATDNGLGVYRDLMFVPTVGGSTDLGLPVMYGSAVATDTNPGGNGNNGCSGQATSPCPQSWTGTFSGNNAIDAASPGVAEGDNQVVVWSMDPLGFNQESGTNHIGGAGLEIKVDHSGPKLDLSGSLIDAPSGDLDVKPYDLHVLARDGSSQSPELYRSGVHEIKVYLNDPTGTTQSALLSTTTGQTVPANPSCVPPANPGYSCELSADYSLDVQSLISAGRMHTGHNTLTIVSTDFAGNSTDGLPNKATRTLSLNVSGPSGVILTPKAGDSSAGRFGLSAERRDPTMNFVTFEYRRPGTGQWCEIPASTLTLDSDNAGHPAGDGYTTFACADPGSQLALDATGKTPPITWNVPATPGLRDASGQGHVQDGNIDIRARFSSGSPARQARDNAALFWRLGEAEGPTAADSSGNERTGTYVASPNLSQSGAPIGAADDGAVELNGSNQYLSSDYIPFDLGSTRTFAGWAYREGDGTVDTLFGGDDLDQSQTAPRLQLSVNSGQNQTGKNVTWRPFGTALGAASITWSNVWPGINTWVQWSLVWNDSARTGDLFINGVDKGTQSTTASYNTSGSRDPLVVGAAGDGQNFSDHFQGKEDEFQVYTSGLSASDLTALAANGPDKGFSQTVGVTLSRDDTTSKHASTQVGPGTLDLQTGNYAVSADDVKIDSFGSDLTFSRTYNSRAPSQDFWDVLGPGWVTSIPVDAAGSDYISLIETGPSGDARSAVKVVASDSTEILFTRRGASQDYDVEPMYSGLQLRQDGTQYILTDIDGSSTTFFRPTGAQNLVPLKVQQTGQGAQRTTRYGYEISPLGHVRPTWALAPSPAGVTCTSTDSQGNVQLLPSPPRGCRWLTFSYYPTADGPGDANTFGPCCFRLDHITFHAWDPQSNQMQAVNVAAYDYDSHGELHAAWDPRIGYQGNTDCNGPCPDLKTSYAYDTPVGNSWGHITQITPPGQNSWFLTYKAATSDDPNTGRLDTVRRNMPGVGDATTTVQYGVSLSSPWSMSPSAVSAWHQSDAPVDATAVIPPNPTSGAAQSDLGKATIYYMNRNGDLVNQANPTSDSRGEISTLQYGSHRNVTSQLTPQNRWTALAAGGSSSATADVLETDSVYSSNGVDLLESFGPEHQIQLAGGTLAQARQHAVTTYDEGRPTGQDYHLPTTQVVGARVCSGLSCPMTSGSSSDVETRTTQTAYNWALRQATQVTVDPGSGAHLNLVSKTSYDPATGLTTSTSTPKANSGGTDAHTTNTIYYSAGTQSSDSGCQNKPEWANLPCKTTPAGQPTGGAASLPVTSFQYDIWDDPTTVTDTVPTSGETRTTSTSYDSAGRSVSSSVSAIGSNVGTAVPTVTTAYDASKGLPTTITSSAGTISRVYDAVGRQTSYTDADGKTTTTSYGNLNGPSLTTTALLSGSATDSYTYDGTTGRLSQMADSQVGTFTATSYDANGALLGETMPNGLTVQNAHDATGEPTARNYMLGSSPVMQFSQSESIQGQITTQTASVAGSLTESDHEVYDAAGRLTQSQDSTPSGGCGVQNYTYDGNSNRTAQRTVAPIPGGQCDTDPNHGTLTSHNYDEADRLLNSGSGNNYSYDAFGRALSVPAADAGGQTLSASYYVDDRVRSLTQGGVTKTYTNDPAGRIRLTQTTSQPDQIEHYSGDSDSPSWTAIGASNWQRYVPDIDGSLCANQQGSGGTAGQLTYELTNIHGDVVGETNTAGQLQQQFKTNEFGVPSGSQPSSGYGWLGGKERKAQFASGMTTMGQRVYAPQLGRFLQTDPVSGGSANDYDYANQDPLDQLDLNGTTSGPPGYPVNLACVRHPHQPRCHTNFSLPSLGDVLGAVGHGLKTAWRGIRSAIRALSPPYASQLSHSIRNAFVAAFNFLRPHNRSLGCVTSLAVGAAIAGVGIATDGAIFFTPAGPSLEIAAGGAYSGYLRYC